MTGREAGINTFINFEQVGKFKNSSDTFTDLNNSTSKRVMNLLKPTDLGNSRLFY